MRVPILKVLITVFFIFPTHSHATFVDLIDFAKRNTYDFTTTQKKYHRQEHFGSWSHPAEDCRTTREYLLHTSTESPLKYRPNKTCKISTGLWRTPYKKNSLYQKARNVHIDHLVPLKEAFISGAHQWSQPMRCHYNNFIHYPYHLVVVGAQENLKKKDHDLSQYLPPNKSFKCEYIKHWLTVKAIWNLKIDLKEYNALIWHINNNLCNPKAFTMKVDEFNHYRSLANNPSRECLLRSR